MNIRESKEAIREGKLMTLHELYEERARAPDRRCPKKAAMTALAVYNAAQSVFKGFGALDDMMSSEMINDLRMETIGTAKRTVDRYFSTCQDLIRSLLAGKMVTQPQKSYDIAYFVADTITALGHTMAMLQAVDDFKRLIDDNTAERMEAALIIMRHVSASAEELSHYHAMKMSERGGSFTEINGKRVAQN